jgi:hypothetical protein
MYAPIIAMRNRILYASMSDFFVRETYARGRIERGMIRLRPIHPSSPQLMIATLLILACSAPAIATDITLSWDPNSELDLAGYKLYYGTVSGIYGPPITLGIQTTYTITDLPPGTYFFALKAFNTLRLESGFSNEISTTIPPLPITGKCDINSDSLVNVLDLQVVINAILGTQLLTGKGDLNSDGRIDVLDLQILGNVILGTRSCPL